MKRLLAVLAPLAVAVLLAPEPGLGQFEISSKGATLRIGGRVQFQARRSSCSAFPVQLPCMEEVPATAWFIRRARLELTVTISDFIEGRFAPEFAPSTDILDETNLTDAYGRLNFSEAARLQIGHFKRPFDGFQMMSSTQILTIERDIDIPGVPSTAALSLDEFTEQFNLSNRNNGIMLTGAVADGGFEYWAGVFNGNSATSNNSDADAKQLIGRVQYSTKVGALPLAVAAAGALSAEPFVRPSGERADETYSNFELWVQLGDFDSGLIIQSELFVGQNPLESKAGMPIDLADGDEFANAWATQAIGGYSFPIHGSRFIQAIEAVLRVTYADPNTDQDRNEMWGLTPGVQLFFAERQRIAFNWDFAIFNNDLRTVNSFKTQYQFYF